MASWILPEPVFLVIYCLCTLSIISYSKSTDLCVTYSGYTGSQHFFAPDFIFTLPSSIFESVFAEALAGNQLCTQNKTLDRFLRFEYGFKQSFSLKRVPFLFPPSTLNTLKKRQSRNKLKQIECSMVCFLLMDFFICFFYCPTCRGSSVYHFSESWIRDLILF